MKRYNVVIVGGGSTFTPGFLKSFCRLKEEFPLNKLVLFDIDAERQEPIGEFGKILMKEKYLSLVNQRKLLIIQVVILFKTSF